MLMVTSEAVNHLRAAIHNVVFYMVEQVRGAALPAEQAHLVAKPIRKSVDGLANWVSRRVKHVPELGTGTILHTRIESWQPYRSLAVVTAVSAQLAALMGMTELQGVHPLLLLHGYSNEDKHRTIRPVGFRSVVTRNDKSFFGQNRQMRPTAVGDVLSADVQQGQPVTLETQTAIHIQRPDSQVWVGPGAELAQIHGFVADVVIPAPGPVGSRWFRHAGGMPPIELAPASGRYLCFTEREQIAVMRAEGQSMRTIADRLGRSPSTISRELRRNAATRNGKLEYRASTAQWKADLAARRPESAKLVEHKQLR